MGPIAIIAAIAILVAVRRRKRRQRGASGGQHELASRRLAAAYVGTLVLLAAAVGFDALDVGFEGWLVVAGLSLMTGLLLTTPWAPAAWRLR